MDIKHVLTLEVKRNENVYIFSIPFGAPYGECQDAAIEILQQVHEMSKKAIQEITTPVNFPPEKDNV